MFKFRSYVAKFLVLVGTVTFIFCYFQGSRTWQEKINYLSVDDYAVRNVNVNVRAEENSEAVKHIYSLPLKVNQASMTDGHVKKNSASLKYKNKTVVEMKEAQSSLHELESSLPPEKLLSSDGRPLERLELDTGRGARAPWPGDPECRNVTVRFGRRIPVRALASFPGSGNTWVRYLLEGATGIHTGSVYEDYELYLKGFRGEMERWNSGTTFLQKTHVHEDGEAARFEGRGVLILRNPYRAILAALNFEVGGHRGYASVSNYRRPGWETFVRNNLRIWLLIAKQWLTKGTSVHVLHYELLQEDLTAALTHLLRDLGLPVDSQRLHCLQKYNDGVFRRESQYFPEDLKIFSPGLRKLMDRAIRYVDRLLSKRHLPRVPLHLLEFYNGTVSTAIVRKSCNGSLSQSECDASIDKLNRERRKQSAIAQAFSVQRGSLWSSGVAGQTEDTSLTFKEWVFQQPMVVHLSEYFTDALSSLRTDVLKRQKLKTPLAEDLLDESVFEETNEISPLSSRNL